MKRLTLCFLIIFLTIPFLGGCWNQKELTDLAFVMGVGVDKGKSGQKFTTTFQIVIPGNVSMGTNGGGQGLPVAVYRAGGKNVTETARNVTKMVPRRLYYGHTNLLVISEKLAREGILDIFDVLDRNPEFRTTTEIVIAKDTTADEILTTITNIEKLPVQKITKSLHVTEAMLGESMTITIDDFLNSLVSKGKEPSVSGFALTGKKSARKTSENIGSTVPPAILKADGIAIFRGGKLVGWIEKEHARGVLWATNKIKSTDVSIDWGKKKSALSVVPLRAKTKASVSVINGKPAIHISIKQEGVIEEIDVPLNVNDQKIIGKIEKKVSSKIKAEVLGAINDAKKQKSDIFGFGDMIHRKDPEFWKKAQQNWDERFSDLPVTVDVESYIRREGVRTLPFWSKMK